MARRKQLDALEQEGADLARQAAGEAGEESAAEGPAAAPGGQDAGGGPEAGQADGDGLRPANPFLAAILAKLVGRIGNAICARCGVEPLADAEVREIADAAELVRAQYWALPEMDPKAKAWAALSSALIGVAGARLSTAAVERIMAGLSGRAKGPVMDLDPDPPIAGAAERMQSDGEGSADPIPPRADGQPTYAGA